MHVIRLVHPCGTVVVLRTGGRRIGGEFVSEGGYHDAATGDLTTHCPGCFFGVLLNVSPVSMALFPVAA